MLFAVASAAVLIASKRWQRLQAVPELGALLLLLLIMLSIGFHILSTESPIQYLSRLLLAVVVLGAAALIMPTIAGLLAIAASSLFLFWSFWYSEVGGIFEIISIPLVITFTAILIRSARRWGIQQRVGQEKLMADLQRQELETAQSKAAAEIATRLSARFAHHFNNQLQLVILGVDGAALEIAKEHPSMAFLNEIRESASRGAKMIEGLLRYADPRPLNKTWINPIALVNELGLGNVISDNIHLTQNIAKVSIYADQDQVAIALEELVVNANRAMRGQAGEIHLKVSESGSYVDFCVADEGEGFPTDFIATAAEPFVTDDPMTRFGLGLAFAESVAVRHGGRLNISPNYPRGAMVCLRLKATHAQYAAEVVGGAEPDYEL